VFLHRAAGDRNGQRFADRPVLGLFLYYRQVSNRGWGAPRPSRDSESPTDDDGDGGTASDRNRLRNRLEEQYAPDLGSRTDNKNKVRAQMNKLTNDERAVLLEKLKTATKEQPKGATEKQIAIKFRTSQPTVSRLLKSAREILKGSLREPIPPLTNRQTRREYSSPKPAEYRDPTRPPLSPPIGQSK
jgi:hypothetical protein